MGQLTWSHLKLMKHFIVIVTSGFLVSSTHTEKKKKSKIFFIFYG